ncbi:MAG: thioesterase family protein [Acidimicrobiia bacterium]|nr:thioesterase family protein [Acidimicrobiia bacterium]
MNERQPYPQPGHVLRRLQVVYRAGAAGEMVGSLPDTSPLCGPDGTVRLGGAAIPIDMASGMLSAREVFPDHTATFDLALHLVEPFGPGPADFVARVVRSGRNTLLSRVEMTVGGRTVVEGTITFSRRTVEERYRRDPPDDVVDLAAAGEAPLDRPAADVVGFRDEPGGGTGFDLSLPIRNSFDSIQGGVTALAMEEAACRASGRPGQVRATYVHVYYLAGAKGGPFRVDARRLGPGAYDTELRDTSADRLMAIGSVVLADI